MHLSLWGGVQTLVLTTSELINTSRSDSLEVNSSDSTVMETVKSNMENNIPFQLMYYGFTGMMPISAPITIVGIPLANVFTLRVIADTKVPYQFSLNRDSSLKWNASKLSNTY